MKLLLAILICLLPSAVSAITEAELLAELDSAYITRTTPDPVDARDLPGGRLAEFQVVVYSIEGTVWRPETIRYVTFGGQAYYLHAAPVKLRSTPTDQAFVAEINQKIQAAINARVIEMGEIAQIRGDRALVIADMPDGSQAKYIIEKGQPPRKL